MIGKYTLEIGQKEFFDGMTSSETSADGGFSNRLEKISLYDVGVLRAPGSFTDRTGSTLNGNVIATCGDAKISAIGNDKNFVTDTGRFYSYISNTATLRQTGAKAYSTANTDIIQFQTDTYCTSETDIARLIQSNLTQPDANWESWWTVTKTRAALSTGFRHPMVVFENALWIADGNLLHKWDGTTATYGFLTLSSEQAIIALGIDPSTGKMLISINESFNASDTKPAISKVLLYNGYSNKPDRAVIVDDMVTSIYPMGGTVYMCYGNKFGYWNGTGITLLRRLSNVTLVVDSLVYKHKITNISNTLYLIDGTKILAYGEIVPGKKVFYYAQKPQDVYTATYITALANCGNNQLGAFYYDGTNKKLMSFDVTYTGASTDYSTTVFYSKRYQFPRQIQVRGIYVEFADGVANNTTPGLVALDSNYLSSNSFSSLVNDSGATIYSISRVATTNVKFREIQLQYSFNTSAGVKRFVIDYDIVE